MLDKYEKCAKINNVPCAGIAHPVERHLAKVEVASSSLVARSRKKTTAKAVVFFDGINPCGFVKYASRVKLLRLWMGLF